MAIPCTVFALWWAAACALTAHGEDLVKIKEQAVDFHTSQQAQDIIPRSLRNLSSIIVSKLELTASGDEVIDLEPGVLAQMDNLRGLRLDRVKVDKLPLHLDQLALIKTGVTELPPEAMNVEQLTIEEDQITQIVGLMPRLRNLTLNTPRLKALRLYQVRVDALPLGFAKKKPYLNEVELLMVTGPLPEGFLQGERTLRRYTTSNSGLTSIPWDLFYYSPYLEFIDLSSNKISSLSMWQFDGMPELKTLWLVDNQLTISAMTQVSNHAKLTSLGLTGNPLGDLCVKGGKSKLRFLPKLEYLHLANTGGKHLCKDWITTCRRLVLLNFQNNRVTHLNCDDLRLVRNESVTNPTLDLNGNPIAVVNCTREHYDDALLNQNKITQKKELLLNSPLACSCGWSWMQRTLPHLRVSLVQPDPQKPCSQRQLDEFWTC